MPCSAMQNDSTVNGCWFVCGCDPPVFVTEWGFQPQTREHFRGTAQSFGEKFVRDFLDGRNLNSTAWCWQRPAERFPVRPGPPSW